MAWSHFRVADLVSPSATVATDATEDDFNAELSQTPQLSQRYEPAADVADCRTVASVAVSQAVDAREVAVMFERIVGEISRPGVRRAEAEHRALPLLRARLANDPRLTPIRHARHLCAACSGEETQAAPLLPILTPHRDQSAWVHAGDCHQQYRTDHAAKVEACISAAGLTISKGVAA